MSTFNTVATPVMSAADMAEYQALKAAKVAREAKKQEARTKALLAPLTFKVSQKGAVSAYGMGRFPTTLYKEQWEKLLKQKEELLAFIQANDSQLVTKE